MANWLTKFFTRNNESTVNLKDPQKWFDFFGLGLTKAGAEVTQKTAQGISAFWLADRIISEGVASLPVHIYRRTSKGKEIAFDHPSYEVIHSEPNNVMTSYTLYETMQSNVNIRGNGFAFIDKDSNRRVIALHYIPYEDVTNIKLVDDELFYTIAGLGKTPVPSEHILHIKGLGSGYVGKSPLRVHMENIGVSIAAQEFGATYFGNGVHNTGVLETDAKVEKTAKEIILQGWKEVYGGLKNSNGIALLDQGFKFKKISIPPEEAQFLQTRKFQVEEIARIFNVPPHMLHALDKATLNNVEQMSLNFVIYSLRTWLKRWEMEMNRRLFREDEKKEFFIKFNMEGLLRGDSKARAAYYKDLINTGVMSINEARSLENLNRVDGGDNHYFPLNYTTIDKIGQNE